VRTGHAEANALLQCAKFGVPTEGADIYVTHFPCLQCSKQRIQSGIQTIYYAEDYKNDSFAVQLFKEAGIPTKKVALQHVAVYTNPDEKADFVNELLTKLKKSPIQSHPLEQLKKKAEKI